MQCSDLCKKTTVMLVLVEVNKRNTCGGVCMRAAGPLLPAHPSLSATAGRGSSNGKHCDVVVLYECSTPSGISECVRPKSFNESMDMLSLYIVNLTAVETPF